MQSSLRQKRPFKDVTELKLFLSRKRKNMKMTIKRKYFWNEKNSKIKERKYQDHSNGLNAYLSFILAKDRNDVRKIFFDYNICLRLTVKKTAFLHELVF